MIKSNTNKNDFIIDTGSIDIKQEDTSHIIMGSSTKKAHNQPLNQSHIANLHKIQKIHTLWFTYQGNTPVMVSIYLTHINKEDPNLKQHKLFLKNTNNELVNFDEFYLFKPGDYHNIEIVPLYYKFKKKDNPPIFRLQVFINQILCFQNDLLVYHRSTRIDYHKNTNCVCYFEILFNNINNKYINYNIRKNDFKNFVPSLIIDFDSFPL